MPLAIEGRHRLEGLVTLSGAKNAALPIIAANARRVREAPPDAWHVVHYLATPPTLYRHIVTSLRRAHLHQATSPDGWVRIVIEKPFGHDLAGTDGPPEAQALLTQDDRRWRSLA